MLNIKTVQPNDIDELKEKQEFFIGRNEAIRKLLIKEIESWNSKMDHFKFQFFFSLLVNSFYTKDLLDVINKDYPDNSDNIFKSHKNSTLLDLYQI